MVNNEGSELTILISERVDVCSMLYALRSSTMLHVEHTQSIGHALRCFTTLSSEAEQSMQSL